MRLFALLLAVLLTAPGFSLAQSSLWVTATGYAPLTAGSDPAQARRRAIADALFVAALSAGSEIRGFTATSNARITSDVAFVRPIGSILGHDILSAGTENGLFRVQIRAKIGPALSPTCTQPRPLSIAAFVPTVSIDTAAPAWSSELVGDLQNQLIAALRDHRSVHAVEITSETNSASTSSNYRALTQPRRPALATDITLKTDITLDMSPQDDLTLSALLRLTHPDGQTIETVYSRKTRVSRPGRGLLGGLGGSRDTQINALTSDLPKEVSQLLSQTACAPLNVKMALSNGTITIPLGRENGLLQGAIGFVNARDSAPELLEVVEVSAHEAKLRPIDRTTAASRFHGRTLTFLPTEF